MKKHTVFECEICDRTSRVEQEILDCEAKGRPVPLPKGTIIADHGDKKAMYADITFCVVRHTDYGHWFDYSGWACRDNGVGDSLGKELCGPLHAHGEPNPEHPTFKRMVAYLKKEGITPYVHYKDEVLTLDTFLARRKRVKALKKMGVEA